MAVTSERRVALERVELEVEEDDDFQYEEVTLGDEELGGVLDAEDGEGVGGAVGGSLEDALLTMRRVEGGEGGDASTAPIGGEEGGGGLVSGATTSIEDFLRNFLTRQGLSRTLEAFNNEWYEKLSRGELGGREGWVPEVFARNEALEERVQRLELELKQSREVARRAQGTWDKFRRERDFHRMHHKRVMQEKQKLIVEIKRLKRHYEAYEPTIEELKEKYELAMKEKMLTRLERDRVMGRCKALEQQLRAVEVAAEGVMEAGGEGKGGGKGGKGGGKSGGKGGRRGGGGGVETKRGAGSEFPSEDAVNPFLSVVFDAPAVAEFTSLCVLEGHGAAVSTVAFHPSRPIVATGSDDTMWRLFTAPEGELVMEGDGHRDWIAGLAFHPRGSHLLTGAADGLVKLWDFASAACASTWSDHAGVVWDVAWFHTGDFAASCSLDQTTKLWDAATGKCRQTFRGHVDSVNAVQFQPFSSNLATGSGDKTVSLWDARSGLCVQTFYGHRNAVSSVAFTVRGDTVISSDADGVVKLWDVRMVEERREIEAASAAANHVACDRSSLPLAVACDDAAVRIYSAENGALLKALKGHTDAVQAVAWDCQSRFLVSGASDNTARIWGRPGAGAAPGSGEAM